MRTTLLAFFLLAFAFALSTALAAIDIELAQGQPVKNTDGNDLISGGVYAILSATRDGGGLRLSELDNETCSISVVQDPDSNSTGAPWIIQASNFGYVYTNQLVNITFNGTLNCTNSKKWIVKLFDQVPTVFIGEEDAYTIAGHFQIENYEDAYKIVFCPGFISTCWDLGISPSANRRLVASEASPFKVVFQDLNSPSSASII